jgi:hypothetical protein
MRPGHDLLCRHCGNPFYICAPCFRCHAYCSLICRRNGYEARKRVARKNYAATAEARADHRDRNKQYRVYGRQGSTVMDKTSDRGPDPVPSPKILPDQCIVCFQLRGSFEDLELFTFSSNRWHWRARRKS